MPRCWPSSPGTTSSSTATLGDRDVIEATEFRLRAIHTPGHTANHLCFYLEEERMLFSGDHIMEGSTVVIDPPDGDMEAYLASLEKVRKLRLRSIAPGHGQLVPEDPNALIDEYIRHRLERERQIVDVLDRLGPATIDQLVPEASTPSWPRSSCRSPAVRPSPISSSSSTTVR